MALDAKYLPAFHPFRDDQACSQACSGRTAYSARKNTRVPANARRPASAMADRVGVINHGRIILVEDKVALLRKLGKKQLTLQLQQPLADVPVGLAAHGLTLNPGGNELNYVYDPRGSQDAVAALLDDLARAGIRLKDPHTTQSLLEDAFANPAKGP